MIFGKSKPPLSQNKVGSKGPSLASSSIFAFFRFIKESLNLITTEEFVKPTNQLIIHRLLNNKVQISSLLLSQLVCHSGKGNCPLKCEPLFIVTEVIFCKNKSN